MQPDSGLTLPSLPPSTTWLLLLVQVCSLTSRCVFAWHSSAAEAARTAPDTSAFLPRLALLAQY